MSDLTGKTPVLRLLLQVMSDMPVIVKKLLM
jgi:hypothetical protein